MRAIPNQKHKETASNNRKPRMERYQKPYKEVRGGQAQEADLNNASGTFETTAESSNKATPRSTQTPQNTFRNQIKNPIYRWIETFICQIDLKQPDRKWKFGCNRKKTSKLTMKPKPDLDSCLVGLTDDSNSTVGPQIHNSWDDHGGGEPPAKGTPWGLGGWRRDRGFRYGDKEKRKAMARVIKGQPGSHQVNLVITSIGPTDISIRHRIRFD